MENNTYWEKRATEIAQETWKTEAQIEKELNVLYMQYLEDIKKEVAAFYAEYAKEGQMAPSVAQELMTHAEKIRAANNLPSLLGLLNEQTSNPKVAQELAKLKATTPVTRLENLMKSISIKTIELANAQEQLNKDSLAQSYQDQYYKTLYSLSPVGESFSLLPEKAILAALSMPFKGTYFSEAIWDNREMLVKKLRVAITEGLIKGTSYKKMAKILADELNVSFAAALRIIRTETNKIISESNKKAYEDSGVVQEFQFIATLDSRTSKTCQQHDLKHWPMSKYEVGVTVPPLHPNCRSTVAPYFGPQEDTRIDGDGNYVSSEMSYEEWLKQLG